MRSCLLPFSLLPALLATSACSTFASNIAGDFECRAGLTKNTRACASASRIDAQAIAELAQAEEHNALAPRAGVEQDDRARTSERTLRIVFPAHIDANGTLHAEAVAWTVVAKPDWTARLRRKAEDNGSSFASAVARALRHAQKNATPPDAGAGPSSPSDGSLETADTDPFAYASPLVLPSTAREAVAGATAPAVEGFDMSPLHVRTPRSTSPEIAPAYPSAEAIDAAKAKRDPEQ